MHCRPLDWAALSDGQGPIVGWGRLPTFPGIAIIDRETGHLPLSKGMKLRLAFIYMVIVIFFLIVGALFY